jgi:2-oxo-4-hydroxy-4-carboxy-5-ureidoimidazoline decarboxylase
MVCVLTGADREEGWVWFNALSRADVERELFACCASRRWVRIVADGRPYSTPGDLLDAAGRAAKALDWDDVSEALDAHPRIGDRARGDGRAASWSRGEQAGVTADDAAGLAEGNAAYEKRFGHVFLICASGRTSGEMLTELRTRLGNDPATERGVVHGELVKITELRLRKLIEEKS